MKNFPIIDKETGREYWISRSVAVLVKLFAKDIRGNKYVLAVQRGEGTPDPEFVGSYCMPCGYVDFDENIAQAAQRELKEETGLTFPLCDFKLVGINDDPNGDKRQNITFRYKVTSFTPIEDLKLMLTTKNSEKDEVSAIKFIKLEDIDSYKWAFNHDKILKYE